MPGALVSGDLEKIAEACGQEEVTLSWLLSHFWASEGAKVIKTAVVDGDTKHLAIRVPTIVPQQTADGRCVFLSADNKCSIHEVSPFGCAYHDMHMDKEEAYRRSEIAVRDQLVSHRDNDDYARYCLLLSQLRREAPPLDSRRAAFDTEIRRIEQEQQDVDRSTAG